MIFDEMLLFLIKNALISKNQSDFKPGDPFVNQLLSIRQVIYKSFNGGFDVTSVSLDISKVFDKVWAKVNFLKLILYVASF